MDILAIILLIGILAIDGFKLYRELKPEKKEKKPKLNKEQQKKQEELRKHFENLMGYDYDEALRGDKKAD